MGKDWRNNPGKYRKNKDFQKKQKRKNGKGKNRPDFNRGYSPFEDSQEEHESFS